ncbi:MAG: hypothetical protein C4520_10945 [Candidatus Abyssobacteria bacterium SURF_5]|uniref:Tyrosine-protein kinase G-rich domain-containing protein n=1 Tax=Abyssobacteria bacterium (strain SURF_5) TaxID=2093360 RepID=A0A3A4NQB2_ABYX5|nr:MAG: hypothetical protein C4520_10945 [Candidatus Abyssubacteria bacterium SURF_5]
MQASNKVDVQQYLDMVTKYKWHGVIPASILMLILAIATSFLPKVYKSSCLVEVDRGAIANPLKTERDRPRNLSEYLTFFSENAIKWSILSQVVDKVGVNTILENSDKYNLRTISKLIGLVGPVRESGKSVDQEYLRKEAVINLLKKEITFTQKPPKFLLLEYSGTDANINAKVLNTLVAMLIEERTKAGLAQAGQTYDFIRAEMESYRRKLESAEVNLREFKEQHVTELPSNMNINITQLMNDKSELMAAEAEIKELTSRVQYIDEQLKKQKELIVSEVTLEANPMLAMLNQRIIDAEIELTNLITNYTELHPRVIETKSRLANLKKQREGVTESTLNSETTILNPVYQQLTQDKQNALLRKELLTSRAGHLRQNIDENTARVRSMPSQEQQLLTLTRNYEVTANIYNMFLQKLEEARLNEKLIAAATDEDSFRVIEYARASLRPIAPVRLKLFLIILLIGTGTGAGIVALFNYFDDSLKSIEEAKEFLGKPFLGTVPSLSEKNNNGSIYTYLVTKGRHVSRIL